MRRHFRRRAAGPGPGESTPDDGAAPNGPNTAARLLPAAERLFGGQRGLNRPLGSEFTGMGRLHRSWSWGKGPVEDHQRAAPRDAADIGGQGDASRAEYADGIPVQRREGVAPPTHRSRWDTRSAELLRDPGLGGGRAQPARARRLGLDDLRTPARVEQYYRRSQPVGGPHQAQARAASTTPADRGEVESYLAVRTRGRDDGCAMMQERLGRAARRKDVPARALTGFTNCMDRES